MAELEKTGKMTPGSRTDLGRIGLNYAPSNPSIVYAQVEGPEGRGGLYRSNDNGVTWEKRNSYDQQGQYYSKVQVDTASPERVYIQGVMIMVSDDGGRTMTALPSRNKHVDNHEIWVEPANNSHYLVGCDGGLYESFDRAATGSLLGTARGIAGRTGEAQQAIFAQEGVDLSRVIIGHSGDSEDLRYLRGLMERGSTIGMDRFGLDRRLRTGRAAWSVGARALPRSASSSFVVSRLTADFSPPASPASRTGMDADPFPFLGGLFRAAAAPGLSTSADAEDLAAISLWIRDARQRRAPRHDHRPARDAGGHVLQRLEDHGQLGGRCGRAGHARQDGVAQRVPRRRDGAGVWRGGVRRIRNEDVAAGPAGHDQVRERWNGHRDNARHIPAGRRTAPGARLRTGRRPLGPPQVGRATRAGRPRLRLAATSSSRRRPFCRRSRPP